MSEPRDNAEPLDGWQLPPRCCGTWATGLVCGVCGQWLREQPIPENVVLSDN